MSGSTGSPNPRKLLSTLALPTVREYGQHTKLFPDFDWSTITDDEREPLLEAFDKLTPEARAPMVAELIEADFMATEIGYKALLGEAKPKKIDLAAEFDETVGLHDRALLTYVRHHEIWDNAARFAIADTLSEGKSWRKRKNVPVATPHFGAEFLTALKKDLSFCYREEGRGEFCEVEHAIRDEAQHYFFATMSDYPRNSGFFDPKTGKLRRTIQPGTYEVVLVYEAGQHSSTIDIHARGGAKVQDAIMQRFCSIVLKQALPPESGKISKAITMDMAVFRQRPDWKLDAKDGIASVRVISMRFGRVGHVGRKHAVEIDVRKDKDADVYDELASTMKAQVVEPDHLLPAKVVLLFTERGEAKRGNTFKVTVGFPNTCTAKSLPDLRRRVVEKYLKLWKVDVSGPVARSAKPGQ